MMSPVKITVNKNIELSWREKMTVQDVIRMMNYTFPHIIVTINGVLVKQDAYAQTEVPRKADVRIIHLIAGG
jgi:thiamine biosynthesis protein ThiS